MTIKKFDPLFYTSVQYWNNFEEVAESFDDVQSFINKVITVTNENKIAWRGQADARWGLESTLYRKMFDYATEKKRELKTFLTEKDMISIINTFQEKVKELAKYPSQGFSDSIPLLTSLLDKINKYVIKARLRLKRHLNKGNTIDIANDIIMDALEIERQHLSNDIHWRLAHILNFSISDYATRKSQTLYLIENNLFDIERKIIKRFREWGLHRTTQLGHLSALEQLAIMQHYGVPTRLIDISFNPLIALFFAVANSYFDDRDARLFAFDASTNMVNPEWENSEDIPWQTPGKESESWKTKAFVWKPPEFDKRISAQNAGFIFGRIPKKLSIPRSTNTKDDGYCNAEEVKRITSIPVRAYRLNNKKKYLYTPLFTIRIKKECKQDIRKTLENAYGYSMARILPDIPGFTQFINTELDGLQTFKG